MSRISDDSINFNLSNQNNINIDQSELPLPNYNDVFIERLYVDDSDHLNHSDRLENLHNKKITFQGIKSTLNEICDKIGNFALKILGISKQKVTPEITPEIIPEQNKKPAITEKTKEQVQKGFEKAKHFGKGLSHADKNGLVGLLMQEDYRPEAFIKGNPRMNVFERDVRNWKAQGDADPSLETYFETLNRDLDEIAGRTFVRHIKGSVDYLDEAGAAGVKVEFQEGALVRNGELMKPLSNFQQDRGTERLFVISNEGGFYCLDTEEQVAHHSSILGGKSVLSAGALSVDEKGKLLSINNQSGHYKPNEINFINSLMYLTNQGVDLSTTSIVLSKFENDGMYSTKFPGIEAYCKSIKELSFPPGTTNHQIVSILDFIASNGGNLKDLKVTQGNTQVSVEDYLKQITTLENVEDKSQLNKNLQFLEKNNFDFNKINTISNYSGGSANVLMKFLKAHNHDMNLVVNLR